VISRFAWADQFKKTESQLNRKRQEKKKKRSVLKKKKMLKYKL
jgi:hypothetical protein